MLSWLNLDIFEKQRETESNGISCFSILMYALYVLYRNLYVDLYDCKLEFLTCNFVS